MSIAPLKISFCTTCMNRIEHLQRTLPQNFKDNADYPNIEFVILDYNSTDGLEQWMKKNFTKWQEKVVYYKTLQPQNYARSHSRNMAFRLATGDILCNLDADNFAGKNFAGFINQIFSSNCEVYLAAQKDNLQDIGGKICFKKSDFENIRGYDEEIINFGFEDNDFKNRLTKSGLIPKYFNHDKFTKVIMHNDVYRIKNERIYKNLSRLFVKKISPWQTQILFIFNDSTFESAEIIDNLYRPAATVSGRIQPLDTTYRFTILENSHKKGVFDGEYPNFERIQDEEQILTIIYFYSQVVNKEIWIKNMKNKTITVNPDGFGKGIVYRNFDYANPIQL